MGRTLLVAGFTSPIVKSLLRELPPSGWQLFGLYRTNAARAEALAQEARTLGFDVEARCCDVRDAEQVGKLCDALPQVPSPVDLLYTAAAPLRLQAIARSPPAAFRLQFDTQVMGAVHLVQLLAPRWRRLGQASAVFVLSAVTRGAPGSGLGPYVAGKFALLGFAETLSLEQGRGGLSVSAVSPTVFESALWAGVPRHARPAAGRDPDSALLQSSRVAVAIRDLLMRPPSADRAGAPFINVLVGPNAQDPPTG